MKSDIEILAEVLQKEQPDEFATKAIPEIIKYLLEPEDKDAIQTVLNAMSAVRSQMRGRLEELKKYAVHDSDCTWYNWWNKEDKCTCGLDQILKTV